MTNKEERETDENVSNFKHIHEDDKLSPIKVIEMESIKQSSENDRSRALSIDINDNALQKQVICPCCGRQALVTTQIKHT